jgi:hypothetical protein
MAAPTDIPLDVPAADAVEQAADLRPDAIIPRALTPEVPDADAAEQATDLFPDEIWPPRVGDLREVDEYDAVEQSIVVEEDDGDDYR